MRRRPLPCLSSERCHANGIYGASLRAAYYYVFGREMLEQLLGSCVTTCTLRLESRKDVEHERMTRVSRRAIEPRRLLDVALLYLSVVALGLHTASKRQLPRVPLSVPL